MAKPSFKPGPRKEELLDRLALSKLALKIYPKPSLSQICLTRVPMVKQSSADSMTHGPAMTKSRSRSIIMVCYSRHDKRQSRWKQLDPDWRMAAGFAVDLDGDGQRGFDLDRPAFRVDDAFL